MRATPSPGRGTVATAPDGPGGRTPRTDTGRASIRTRVRGRPSPWLRTGRRPSAARPGRGRRGTGLPSDGRIPRAQCACPAWAIVPGALRRTA